MQYCSTLNCGQIFLAENDTFKQGISPEHCHPVFLQGTCNVRTILLQAASVYQMRRELNWLLPACLMDHHSLSAPLWRSVSPYAAEDILSYKPCSTLFYLVSSSRLSSDWSLTYGWMCDHVHLATKLSCEILDEVIDVSLQQGEDVRVERIHLVKRIVV